MFTCPGGNPGEGIHAARLGPFALWDIVLTVAACLALKAFVFKNTNFFVILLVAVALGIATHKILGIHTKLNTIIFGG